MRFLQRIIAVLRIFGHGKSGSSLLICLLSALGICIFCGTDDQESINLYMEKLQSLSEHHICREQKAAVADFYLKHSEAHPGKRRRHKTREIFNKERNYLKSQWEMKYGLKWPTESTIKRGQIKKIAYQAHHIVPINAGGVNFWWNLSPLNAQNHEQLHQSKEEKACFSHDFFQRKFYRFLLKLETYLPQITRKLQLKFTQPI